ncbi:MAG: hypothetical protein IJZ10_04210 [Thermoguttaceae bacterium]|nr:hypothetical protein [Thermoguttaceae bacterium]
MTYLATVYNVFIASPGDAQELREVAEEVIVDWNHEHSYDKKVVLLPLLWEKDSAPGNERGQDIINESCVDKSDLVVAIWRYHIGLGTLEEVARSIDSAKQVLQYFSTEAFVPHKYVVSEEENYKARQLAQLKKQMQEKGAPYYAEYDSPQTFRERFRRHLVQKINELHSNSYAQKPALLPAASKILRTNSDPQSTTSHFNEMQHKAEQDFDEAIKLIQQIPDAQDILKVLWESFCSQEDNQYFTVGHFIEPGLLGESHVFGIKINKTIYFPKIRFRRLKRIMEVLCANKFCTLTGFLPPPDDARRYRLTNFFLQNAPKHSDFQYIQRSLFDL